MIKDKSLLQHTYEIIFNREIKDLEIIAIKIALSIIFSFMLNRKRMGYHIYIALLIHFFIYNIDDLCLLYSLYFINISYYVRMKQSLFKMYFLTFFNLGILVLGSFYFKDKGNPTSVGCEIMMIVPKIYFLYQERKMKITSVIGYFFYVPMIPSGPAVRINELKLFIPIKIRGILLKSVRSAFFYLILRYENYFKSFPKEISNQWTDFLHNVLFYQLFTICYRFKYYFIWEISSLCFYLSGLDLANIDFLKVELAPSLKIVGKEWNSWTGIWLKECFFERIDSFFIGGIMTFFISALWHGAHLHDFSFLLLFSLFMPIQASFHALIPESIVKKVYCIIETNLLISYIPLHFYYSNIKQGNRMYRRMYYYGHFYMLLIFVVMVLSNLRIKKEKRKEEIAFVKIK